ncbi:secreted RxLR effector protein 78-like [Cryptomeria japonica]|uniref:secreted RxLR effector protein 78-like n=1 Tax=Cryptomeria japonica TaxID=3369 RepID=UPI0027D9FB74|nr:secreted RxLR effector protein 78-like [Cryptomeria japonica]
MKIISSEQHGFTLGREITDNIIMATETIHSMHSSKAKGMIIKLDVSKAYDCVSWNFLFEVLKKIGFKQKWLDCIKHCVSSMNYFVIFNKTVSSFFQATNGLRQGDPLSPFLFVLMAEVLGRSIKYSVGQGAWKGISIKGYMGPMSHSQFADDTILFGEASEREALIIKKGARLI